MSLGPDGNRWDLEGLGVGPVSLVGDAVAFVGGGLTLVRGPVAFVGDGLTLVGDAIPLVGDGLTLVGRPVPIVGSGLTPLNTHRLAGLDPVDPTRLICACMLARRPDSSRKLPRPLSLKPCPHGRNHLTQPRRVRPG